MFISILFPLLLSKTSFYEKKNVLKKKKTHFKSVQKAKWVQIQVNSTKISDKITKFHKLSAKTIEMHMHIKCRVQIIHLNHKTNKN